MFQNETFPPYDPNIDEYRNILKRDIHIVASHPKIFPYNEATRWCFAHLQKDTILIVNASGLPIASLKA
jgi:hypothetical protein